MGRDVIGVIKYSVYGVRGDKEALFLFSFSGAGNFVFLRDMTRKYPFGYDYRCFSFIPSLFVCPFHLQDLFVAVQG